jgi:hypothetical protein
MSGGPPDQIANPRDNTGANSGCTMSIRTKEFLNSARNMSKIDIYEIAQVCKKDPLFNGATLEVKNYGNADDYAAHITMPDGKTREFYDLEDFRRWHARQAL